MYVFSQCLRSGLCPPQVYVDEFKYIYQFWHDCSHHVSYYCSIYFRSTAVLPVAVEFLIYICFTFFLWNKYLMMGVKLLLSAPVRISNRSHLYFRNIFYFSYPFLLNFSFFILFCSQTSYYSIWNLLKTFTSSLIPPSSTDSLRTDCALTNLLLVAVLP